MLTPTEAAHLILEHIAPLPAAPRPLREALDRVLAEDVKSPIDLPAWDNSAMDGYAARAVDVESAAPDHKVALAVIEAVAAGQFPTKPIGSGQVTRIFTGAPLPAGADTVVRQEDTEPAESGRIRVVTGRDARKNVRYRGEDIRKGDVVLGAGTPLGPAQLGVLASIAQATPLVYDAPRVAFMGSGDEIVDLDRADDILSGKKVATSNSYTLHALIKQNGAIPVDLGLARDTKESLRDHLAAARKGSDLLVTTAGVSVGEHDFVREVLTELGGEIKLWRIAMRPGAPVGFGLLGETPWIGLPGNPIHGVSPSRPNPTGAPGRMAMRHSLISPPSSVRTSRTKSCSPTLTPAVVTSRSEPFRAAARWSRRLSFVSRARPRSTGIAPFCLISACSV